MEDRFTTIDGVRIPRFLYGTAWKADRTRGLVATALGLGFRGVDTANQLRHYDEAEAGRGVADSIAAGVTARDELFLQTKFTSRDGQDHRLPYDPAATVGEQVRQSFASSREHLGVSTIDSYILHGPTRRIGLASADWEAWRAIEDLHAEGGPRLIGVSNVSLDQLREFRRGARGPLHFVQNRCFAAQGWDREVRAFCDAHGIVYQGFSLLTANRQALADREVARIAARHGRTVAQVAFRFALQVGILPLTGTADAGHMAEDLEAFDFSLDDAEVDRIERLAG